jgi:hypothetical protein
MRATVGATKIARAFDTTREATLIQLDPPLARMIVGGPGWDGPTGPGIANFLEPGHPDDDLVWIIDLHANGQTWCVPNRYVRAPRNITYGRKQEVSHREQPANGRMVGGS